MAVEVKKLDLQVGDVVEIDNRRYGVVSDRVGGVALEPVITTTVDELHAKHGTHPLTEEEFERHFGALPSDDEG